MASTKYDGGAQYARTIFIPFGPALGANTITADLEPGAVITGGVVRTTAAGAASLKVTVKDAAGTPVSLFGSADAATLVATAMPVAGLGMSYPAGTTLTVALSASDADAAGTISIDYIIAGRQNEN